MKRMGIYAITHTDSGRVYIGSTSNIASRFRDHRRFLRIGQHPNAYLQRSWDRHGAAAFTFDVIEEIAEVGGLIEREQFYIDSFDSSCHAKGFNLSPTAGSTRGAKRTPEARALQSRLMTGRKRPPEDCKKISLGQLGKKHSESWCRNISAALKKPEARAKLAAGQRAFDQTPAGRAHRQRLREMAAARRDTPEQREAKRIRMTGTRASDAAREAMRASSRLFWDSPAGKARAAAHSQWVRDHRAKKATA